MTAASCGTVRTKLSAYRDGPLDDAAALDVERHLEVCAGCREELAGIDEVARLVTGTAIAAPPGFGDRLQARLRARRAAENAWAHRARLARRASLLAAALLVALLAGLGPAIVRDTRTVDPSIVDDETLNFVLFGAADSIDPAGFSPSEGEYSPYSGDAP